MSSATILRAIKKQVATQHYEWTSGAHVHNIDPARAMEEFRAIYEQHGAIKPDLVVQRAQPESNHLHDHFEWDTQKAAAAHHITQARELMRWLVVVPVREDNTRMAPVRALVKIQPTADDMEEMGIDADTDRAYEPNVYIPIHKAMSEEDYRRIHLRKVWNEFMSLRRKYRDVREFAAIYEALDAIKDRIEGGAS